MIGGIRQCWVVLLLSAVAGCGRFSSDPVTQFEKIVRDVESHRFEKIAITEVRYDVQKTNSLVSPYFGLIRYKARDQLGEYELRSEFAFQSGIWRFKRTIITATQEEPPDWMDPNKYLIERYSR